MSLECGWKAADSSGGKWVSLSQEKWRIGQNRIRNLYWHCFIGTKWGHGQTWKLKEFGNGSCQMWQSLVLTQNQHPWPAMCKTFVPDVYHCKRTLSRTCLVVWRHQYIYIYNISTLSKNLRGAHPCRTWAHKPGNCPSTFLLDDISIT